MNLEQFIIANTTILTMVLITTWIYLGYRIYKATRQRKLERQRQCLCQWHKKAHPKRAIQETLSSFLAFDLICLSLQFLLLQVNEEETPLPRSWSTKDKYQYIGLSQSNLRVHYKVAISPLETALRAMGNPLNTIPRAMGNQFKNHP